MSHVLPLSLQAREPGRIRPDLERLQEALETLGNPQQDVRSILVVGTNGKGSVAAMLEGVLAAHGALTGLYTSPHLLHVEERIRIDRRPVPAAVLERYLSELEPFPDLTFFETLTAAAFIAFADVGVDCAVLEAGMGGRWDATRLAASEIAGLTNVGTDHRAWLGEARSTIASDKGAALAAAHHAVIGPGVDPEIVASLEAPNARRAHEVMGLLEIGNSSMEVMLDGHDVELQAPLAGGHQLHNLALALALAGCAVEAGWLPRLEVEAVKSGLGDLRWPGRLSRHEIRGRSVVLDCAHNLEAAHALAAYLSGCERRYNLLFSCLDDKPVETMAAVLRPQVERVAVCQLGDSRAMSVQRLAAAFPDAVTAASPLDGLQRLSDPVLVAGSLRLVGAVLGLGEEGGGS